MITRKNVYWGCGGFAVAAFLAVAAEPICDFVAGRLENTRLVNAACEQINADLHVAFMAVVRNSGYDLNFHKDDFAFMNPKISSDVPGKEFSGECMLYIKPLAVERR